MPTSYLSQQRHFPVSVQNLARLAGLLVMSGQFLLAQNAPLISGAVGMFSSTNTGTNFLQPVVAPLVALPVRHNLLVEARFDLRGFYIQNNNTGPYQGSFFKSTQ